MSDPGPGDREEDSHPPQTKDLKEYLQDVMDWTAYQAEAYIAVVRDGPLEPSEIVAITDIPQGRVYNVMGQLEGEAVNVQGHQPKKYQAQHPRSLITEKKEEFDRKAEETTNILEYQHEIQREKQDPRHPAWIIPGIAGTKRELMDGISEAGTSISIVDQDGSWIQNNEIRDLSRLSNSGVEIEIIGLPEWINQLADFAEETNSKVWEHRDIRSSFYIIDENLVIMRIGQGRTGVKIRDKGTVKVLRRAFDDYKEEATRIPTNA